MKLENRVKLNWFTVRSSENRAIKNFLIKKIRSHEPKFPLSNSALRDLNYEDLLEISIPCVNKSLEIDFVTGRDYNDGSDAKACKSADRNNSKKKGRWTNSFFISGVKNKKGALRIVAYNTIQQKFHFFYIEHEKYNHLNSPIEIVIEIVHNEYKDPRFTGVPQNKKWKWWDCECTSFEEMCLK